MKNESLKRHDQPLLIHFFLGKRESSKAEASQGIFSGGTPRPLKGYHAPPVGGPGGEGPPDGSEVSFFQTMQSIRKWIEFSKISTFFFPKKSIFSKKNFEKLNIFDRNFWIFSNNYLKNFNFYETYKYREIFAEFCYLVEKFTVAAKGIFSGGTLGPLKDYQAPPAGGPGAEGPPDGSEVSFFKTMQSIRKWIEFSKISTFFLPKKIYFF